MANIDQDQAVATDEVRYLSKTEQHEKLVTGIECWQ